MKLDNPSILRVEIDPNAYLHSAASKQALWYLLNRLFIGEEIAESELETWGVRVSLLDDFIQVNRLDPGD